MAVEMAMNSNATMVTIAMTATEMSRYAGANTPGAGPAPTRSASPVVLIASECRNRPSAVRVGVHIRSGGPVPIGPMGESGMDEVRAVISPCQARCAWSSPASRLGDDLLFACSACGSEWVASEAWTPVDWQGVVPDAVQAERARGA